MIKQLLLIVVFQLATGFTAKSAHPDLDGLIDFYTATEGDNWTNTYGWKEGVAGLSCDPCNYNGRAWYGIQCENDRVTMIDMGGHESLAVYEGDVTTLGLIGGNNLKGTIPQIYLSELKVLKFGSDSLSGPLPDFDGLPKLEQFLCSSINITTVPDLSSVPNLKTIYINHGTLERIFPDFSNLPKLENLIFHFCSFNELPNFTSLPELRRLEIFHGVFEDTIPNFTGLPKLQKLLLRANLLKGEIPKFDHLTNLEILDLSSNFDLIGTIPDLTHLLELKELYITKNNLEGCFPSYVCDLDVFRAEQNNQLPWNGDHTNFCQGMNQLEAPCNTDDGIPLEGMIDSSCYCMPLIVDFDNDGYPSPEDCDDSNADINPGVDEIPYNFIDDDCNPSTPDDDLDGDGYYFGWRDCDDSDPNVNIGQVEIPYNSKDDDCDPTTLDDDLDQDGFLLADDCNDNNSNINPNQIEKPYNGIDDDCNSATPDDDLDQDGFLLADDCDDNNSSINPNQTEQPYNGIDDDCDSATLDDDLDQDGFLLADDCDDNNLNINPDADEIANNNIDEDCDGMDLITSIHKISNTTINIYPNPVVNIINIDVKGKLDYQTSIYDLEGKLIFSTLNRSQLQVHSLPMGTYFIEIQDLQTGKKVIERILISR